MELIKLSIDSKGRQWWRLNCAGCAGQYGCLEAPYQPTAPYLCYECRPNDDRILAAFPEASRRAFGREGCGVTANDLAHVLADGTDPYQSEIYRPLIARRLGTLTRKKRVRRGSDRGAPFYRLASDFPEGY